MSAKKWLSSLLLLYIVLGCWRGYVAVFNQGAQEPRQIFPRLVSSLSAEDQAALEQGIIVRNSDQLQTLLEQLGCR